jgi:hypothetical protein
MQDLKYHTVIPENKKDTYGEYETIDLKLSGMGRKLVGGSLRLLGEITVGGNSALSKNICYDGFSGLHTIIDNIKTSFVNVGQVENLDHYARFVSAKAKASLTKNDIAGNSMYVCEARAPDNVISRKLLKGVVGYNAVAATSVVPLNNLDFSVKLDFCLNNMIGDELVSFAKTGDILISLQTARNVAALFGDSDIGGDCVYFLSNIRLSYMSVPDDGKAVKYNMRVVSSLKQSIQSSFANISTKVPIIADSFFMTFIRQDHENSTLYNSSQCEKLPAFQRLEVTYNDNLSQQFTYQIDNEEEVLINYIKAVQKVSGNNTADLSTLASNDAYGVGIQFGSYVDLSKTKLGVNLETGIQSINPFSAYMHFMGVVSL